MSKIAPKHCHVVARPSVRRMGPAAVMTSTQEEYLLNISRPLISLRMMQNIYEKCAEMPSRGAIGCCSNIPDLKKDIHNYTI